ncbi:MAG: hypothetical protein EBZ50_04995 [Alphaproteobacteria bacterium]|nr:hypothetical protein [Alphaproteobacteria bacterium]
MCRRAAPIGADRQCRSRSRHLHAARRQAGALLRQGGQTRPGGGLYYVRPEQTARGDNAVYEMKSDTVTFTGRVVVASDENVVKGDTMVLEIGNRRTTVKPGSGPGQRVRGVFRTRPTAAQPAPVRQPG